MEHGLTRILKNELGDYGLILEYLRLRFGEVDAARVNTYSQNLYFVAAGVGLVLVVFVVFSILSRRFGLRIVERWAAANGFQLVSVKRRTFVPFWPTFSRRFQFFRVTVRDSNGIDRNAWMRLESDCTEPEILDVSWDDKSSTQYRAKVL